jgi:hypothetical protein
MPLAAGNGGVSGEDKSFISKIITFLGRQEIQGRLKREVVDPILNHVMKQVFPYIILICVLFVLLLLAVLMTLGVIIFQLRSLPGAAAGAVSTGAAAAPL